MTSAVSAVDFDSVDLGFPVYTTDHVKGSFPNELSVACPTTIDSVNPVFVRLSYIYLVVRVWVFPRNEVEDSSVTCSVDWTTRKGQHYFHFYAWKLKFHNIQSILTRWVFINNRMFTVLLITTWRMIFYNL